MLPSLHGWDHGCTLPDFRATGRRRDGRGVPGRRHAAGPPRGAEVFTRELAGRPHGPGAVSRETRAALALAAVAAGSYLLMHGSRGIDSVAVMPFANASGNPNVEYISDGITENIINSLSQLPDLTVISRASVFRYKGRDQEPKQRRHSRSGSPRRALERGRAPVTDAGYLDAPFWPSAPSCFA